ncbi:protein MATERNALLY EXPRESSED GENE 5 [Cocos nucifera]|uniref:Protein MATERNALLY EXPRESSED GENE 5 n=1 Tax=Cocos nucifera TaxID=13894 RepID=A0A8K0N7P1_COCNU|nr:protein MATERNALLY EXPRESSED GENE 5 [Cocos nucifera]
MAAPQPPVKRPRPDYGDVPGGSEYGGYYPHEEGRAGHRVIRDTESISASYERFLHDGIISYGGGESLRPVAGGMGGHPVDDLHMMGVGGMDGRSAGYGSGRPETPLPPDASCTLFVEGLPANCTRREVSRFREVRLVNKESRHPGGDPLVLCFVDFSSSSQAAVALDALQGSPVIGHFTSFVSHVLHV